MNQPLNYYRTVADYDGVIQAVKQELTGITTDNYIKWYYKSCADFYFEKSVWLSIGGRFNRSSRERTEFFLRVRSLPSRLYVLRKMHGTKKKPSPKASLTLFFDHKAKALSRQFERGYERALDKNLYLAQRLKDLAEDLRNVVIGFRAARAGDTWLSRLEFEFNPEKLGNDDPGQAGENLAKVEHFRHLLVQFEQEEKNGMPEAPADQAPADQAPADQAPADQAPADLTDKKLEGEGVQKLSLRQIALFHFLSGKPAIKVGDRANALAKAGGWKSGTRLYRLYDAISKPTGITGAYGKEVSPMIDDIKAVLPLLTEAPHKAKATELLEVLRETKRKAGDDSD